MVLKNKQVTRVVILLPALLLYISSFHNLHTRYLKSKQDFICVN